MGKMRFTFDGPISLEFNFGSVRVEAPDIAAAVMQEISTPPEMGESIRLDDCPGQDDSPAQDVLSRKEAKDLYTRLKATGLTDSKIRNRWEKQSALTTAHRESMLAYLEENEKVGDEPETVPDEHKQKAMEALLGVGLTKKQVIERLGDVWTAETLEEGRLWWTELSQAKPAFPTAPPVQEEPAFEGADGEPYDDDFEQNWE